MRRGEIWLVDFNPGNGGGIGKLRPAVILSDEESNAVLSTVIVMPLSTVIEPDTYPYRMTISSRENLKYDSDLCVNELRALSKSRVRKRLASLDVSELESLQNALCQLIR